MRILLGVTDRAETVWDGEVTARDARIVAVEPWRFDYNDAMLTGNRWRVSTHPVRVFAAASTGLSPARPVGPNGILVQVVDETDNSELEVRTARGNFAFRLGDVLYGNRRSYLQGQALVDRVPDWSRVTSSADEQDYPAAAADSSGRGWVAYMEFKHNPDHDRIRLTPNRFDWMDAKTGGDQILVKSYYTNTWSNPIAVSAPGGDLYRPAIAIDGPHAT